MSPGLTSRDGGEECRKQRSPGWKTECILLGFVVLSRGELIQELLGKTLHDVLLLINSVGSRGSGREKLKGLLENILG